MSFEIYNQVDGPIDIYWVNPSESSLVFMSTLPETHSQAFNSYPSHQFIFSFSDEGGTVRTQFTKGERDEIIAIQRGSEGGLLIDASLYQGHFRLDVLISLNCSSENNRKACFLSNKEKFLWCSNKN
jgi:hypothetical protein